MVLLKGENMNGGKDEFDHDDTLDFMIYEDIENEIKQQSGKSGCLRIFIIIILPYFILRHYF